MVRYQLLIEYVGTNFGDGKFKKDNIQDIFRKIFQNF